MMSKSATQYVFIDTNTALHFKRPDQIDWLKLIGASEVVLVATPILLRELEDQKVSNKSRKLRARAGDYIKWMRQFMLVPATEVRHKVTWLFLTDEPQIDFSTERLSETIADDQLIASILYCLRQSKVSLLVVTDDIGLEVKLRNRGIDVLTLPDNQRLPVEVDPLERKNEELQNQISRITSRIPKLSIAFESGVKHHTLQIREPKTTNIKSLEQIKAEYPFTTPVSEASLSKSINTVSRIERMYYSDYQQYLAKYADWQETICRHNMFKLVITNYGIVPASNIDVELYFSDGVVPVDKDDIPKKPTPPIAPNQKNQILEIAPLPRIADMMAAPDSYGTPNIEQDKNSISISYLRLKHGFSKISAPLFFRFISRDAVGPFIINYRLSADELPDAVEGDLHIRIDETNQIQQ